MGLGLEDVGSISGSYSSLLKDLGQVTLSMTASASTLPFLSLSNEGSLILRLPNRSLILTGACATTHMLNNHGPQSDPTVLSRPVTKTFKLLTVILFLNHCEHKLTPSQTLPFSVGVGPV